MTSHRLLPALAAAVIRTRCLSGTRGLTSELRGQSSQPFFHARHIRLTGCDRASVLWAPGQPIRVPAIWYGLCRLSSDLVSAIVWRMRGEIQETAAYLQFRLRIVAVCKTVGSTMRSRWSAGPVKSFRAGVTSRRNGCSAPVLAVDFSLSCEPNRRSEIVRAKDNVSDYSGA